MANCRQSEVATAINITWWRITWKCNKESIESINDRTDLDYDNPQYS